MDMLENLGDNYVVDASFDASAIEATNELQFLRDTEGRPHVLKKFQSPRAMRREFAALSGWGPRLSFSVPQVVRVVEEPGPAILMTRIHGRTPARLDLVSEEVSHLAGCALRELHQLSVVDGDDVTLIEAMEMRYEEARQSAGAWLSGRLMDLVMEQQQRLSSLPDRSRVPCHGDFAGRNWLLDGDTPFALLDFENARLDVAETDLLKLHMEVWSHDTQGKDAFLEGWGRAWDESVASWVRALEVLYLVGTVNWCLGRGQRQEAARPRDRLKLLLQDDR